jgi:hypothetical protein
MKRVVNVALTVVLVLGGVIALRGTADAQPCRAVCGAQRRACTQTGRVTKLACYETCRAGEPRALGACMRGCSSAFRAARGTCRAERAGCLDGCGAPAGPCVGMCGRDLAACVRGVTGDTRACLSACRSSDEPRACIADCTKGLRDGNVLCRSDIQACKVACGGSASGAFPAD